MPLSTNMGFTLRPDIYINVSDGGGGGGNDHVVDLTVAFDSAVLSFVAGSDACALLGPGVCGWLGVLCPANGRVFTVDFARLTTTATTITATAVDDAASETDSDTLVVPKVSKVLLNKQLGAALNAQRTSERFLGRLRRARNRRRERRPRRKA